MFTTRFNPIPGLMNSVAFSSGGFGGYTGSDDDEGGDDNDNGIGDDSSDNDEITLEDDADAFEDLFKPELDKDGKPIESDDDNEDDDEGDFPSQDEVTADLKASIEGYEVPDDLIPDDIDLSDRKQLKTLMTDVGRHAVQAALANMFKPIHIAMSQQAHQLRREIKSSVTGGFQQSKEEEILLEVIPAAGNKVDRKVIDTLFTQAKTRHKDPRKAAQATREAMKAMGMNPNGRKSSNPGKQGKSALDQYAPRLPKLDTARRPTQRNQDRLKR